jgi:hypothetical protein
MRTLGRRALAISDDMHTLDIVLGELVAKTAPALLACHGVGVDTAAILLVAAGDNPERIRNEAAWAHLCGVAPLDACRRANIAGIGSVAPGTVKRTMRCGGSCSPAWAATTAPASTSRVAPKKDSPNARSCAC